jgi:hypothetical protein
MLLVRVLVLLLHMCPNTLSTTDTNLPLDEATGSHHWRTASLLKHLMGPDWFKWARYIKKKYVKN